MVLDKPVTDVVDESAEQLFQRVSAICQPTTRHMSTQEPLQQEIQREKALLESLREKQS